MREPALLDTGRNAKKQVLPIEGSDARASSPGRGQKMQKGHHSVAGARKCKRASTPVPALCFFCPPCPLEQQQGRIFEQCFDLLEEEGASGPVDDAVIA